MRFDEFTTGPFSPRERCDAWQRQPFPCVAGLMEIDPADGAFSSRARTFALGSLFLSDIHHSARTCRRTDEAIGSDGFHPVVLSVCLSGRYGGQTQAGRYRGGPGCVLVLDFASAFQHVSTNSHSVLLVFERSEIQRHIPRIDGLHGLVLSRKDAEPLVRQVVGLLQQLPGMSDEAGAEAGAALTDTILSSLNQTGSLSAAEDARLSQLRADALWIIRQRYREPDLDVARVAALVRASRSTLYRAFAEEEGILAHVTNLRIEQAAIALRDTKDRRLIREIALAVGFDQVSSFNRAFRKRHDCTPRDWREQFRRSAHASPYPSVSDEPQLRRA